MWPVAVIAGGGMAGLTKITSALVRAKAGLLTAGMANPVVSTVETVGSVLISIVAIALPVLALLGVLVIYGAVWRRRAIRGA
jgi:hypothetical protein